MKKDAVKKRGESLFQIAIIGGTLIFLYSIAAVVSGLAQVNWQFSELLRQYIIAIGVAQEFHTLVDFYTHIKGVEYIICVAFLVAFPFFYRYLNRSTADQESAN
jgi:hypothetical protein